MKRDSIYRITWAESPVWLRCLGVVAFVNFFAFWLAAVFLGGDALAGRIEDGHYFLASHGHLRQVSAAMYHYSQIHFVTAIGGIVLLVVASVSIKYRKMMRQAEQSAPAQRP